MNLNDDVLYLIFEYLNLRDQCSAACACLRFRFIIDHIWKKNIKYANMSVLCHIPNTHFRILIESICNHIEEFRLNIVANEEKWKIIKQFSYPNVKSLDLNFNSYSDDSTWPVDISKLYPNLRSLKTTHLKNLENYMYNLKELKYLEDVELFFDQHEVRPLEKLLEENCLKSLTIRNIAGTIKWTSDKAFTNFCALERIYLINVTEMLPSNFALLQNIKELKVQDRNKVEIVKVLRTVTLGIPHKLIELHFAYFTRPLDRFTNALENLKKVMICNTDMRSFSELPIHAPNLREISFIRCKRLQREHIFRFLNSLQMELVDVVDCCPQFAELDINVNEIVKNRKKLLNFNFKPYSANRVKLNVKGLSPLLKITQSPSQLDAKGLEYRRGESNFLCFKFQ